MPIVSVVTPTYRHGPWISRCIDSVRAQTFADWEMFVVDDASPDETPDIVRSYADSRIVYRRRDRRGGLEALPDAYAWALDHAEGEYIAVLEGDDYWPEDKLETQLRAFGGDVVVTWGRGRLVDGNDQPLGELATVRTSKPTVDLDADEMFRRLLGRNLITPSSTVMIRRECLEAVGGFVASPASLYVDLPTWLRLASERTGDFRFVSRVLGYWRRHAGQATRTRAAELDEEHARILEELEDGVDPELLRAYTEYHRARAALLRGQWRDARRRFAGLLGRPSLSPGTRLSCALGVVSGLLHRDLVEGLSRATRRRGMVDS